MRAFKVRRWVAECVSRCFSWLHYGKRVPIRRAPRIPLRRPWCELFQFETRESPTSLSLLSAAAGVGAAAATNALAASAGPAVTTAASTGNGALANTTLYVAPPAAGTPAAPPVSPPAPDQSSPPQTVIAVAPPPWWSSDAVLQDQSQGLGDPNGLFADPVPVEADASAPPLTDNGAMSWQPPGAGNTGGPSTSGSIAVSGGSAESAAPVGNGMPIGGMSPVLLPEMIAVFAV